MRVKDLLLLTAIIITTSCNDKSTENNNSRTLSAADDSFIPIDSANKMLSSYLTSIESPDRDSSLKALIIDANPLRSYLNDTTHGRIDKVKIMFAHTLDYINSGKGGKYAGYKPGALTLILAGYDNEGNYIYKQGNSVLDNTMPCPTDCPPGDAGNNLLIR